MTTATRARTTTRSKPRRPARKTPQPRNGRGRSTAAQKAYARRAQRTAAVQHGGAAPAALLKLRMPQSRASFVLLMMSLLGVGVVLTLWLSTQAIADSYRLDKVRAETGRLSEEAERLQREVAREQTVAALDRKARGLGMVPAGDPARILVTPGGWKKLIGEPKQAQPRQPVVQQPQRRPERDDNRERDSEQLADGDR